MILELSIGKGLKFNEDGEVELNISPESVGSDRILYEPDGLYVVAPQGATTGSGKGYTGVWTQEGIRCGLTSPYASQSDLSGRKEGMLTCTNIVHKVFDSIDESGASLIGIREVDCVMPGDMYRVAQDNGKYKYFLVLECNRAVDINGGNTSIRSSILLGEW